MARSVTQPASSDSDLPTIEETLQQLRDKIKRSSSYARRHDKPYVSDSEPERPTLASSPSSDDQFYATKSRLPTKSLSAEKSSKTSSPAARSPLQQLRRSPFQAASPVVSSRRKVISLDSSDPAPPPRALPNSPKGKARAIEDRPPTPLVRFSGLSTPPTASPHAIPPLPSTPASNGFNGIIIFEPGPSKPATIGRPKPRPAQVPFKPPATPSRLPNATQSRTSKTSATKRKVPGTPSAAQLKREWTVKRDELAKRLIEEMQEKVFDGRLPDDLAVVWNARLNTTAGRAKWKRHRYADGQERHEATIELATKVVDGPDRLNNTLAHELCHVAAFIIDGELKPPHGAAFKRWARAVSEARPDIEVRTTHDYEISYRYVWRCTNELCAKQYSRHSKSIDPSLHACGLCEGRLVQITPVPAANATPAKRPSASSRKKLPVPPTPRVISLDEDSESEGEIEKALNALELSSD